ncbi:MAG TPA: D-alanyl-D-alanine carboxypeptidase/D-alanyl-D-alanine-endopeptidase [Longimicrobiales bacterium]
MRRFLVVPPLVLLGCTPVLHRSAPPRAPGLAAVVDSVVSVPALARTSFGMEVYDPAAGRVVFALNPDKHLMPASNTKLVATSAAMALLGPDWRYRTEVYALGLDARGAAKGVLLLARGDPTWAPPFVPGDFTVPAALADSIRAAGVRRIDGDLVIDASAFERAGLNDSWNLGDLPWYYAAPTGALAIGEGTRRYVVLPGMGVGLPAAVRFIGPEPQSPVLNAITTGLSDSRRNVEPERLPGVDTLYLRGTVPFGVAADTEVTTVADAPVFAARELAAELAARGIQVNGAIRVLHDSVEAAGLAAATASARRPVASWTSPPVAEIVAACLKPSDNWLAEQLLKTIGLQKGGRGSWQAGLAVERAYLTGTVGLDTLDFHLRDGSGLSAQNLLTAHAIVRLLAYVAAQPWGATYRAALAEPGQKGTLQRRLVAYQGRLYAKTGSIANVNSLSGYIRADDGRDLVFSILSNGSGVSPALVRGAIDRIVVAIAANGATAANNAANGGRP